MKKSFINAVLAAGVIAALMFLTSCQREEIVYPTSNYYLAITVEPDVQQKDYVKPTIFVASFYDVETGKLAYSTFVRSESHPMGLPAGGFVTGITPGDYDLIIYNFDTHVTSIEEKGWYDRIYAFAEVAGRSKDVPITYAPDHLYWHKERVHVPYITEHDGVHIIRASLRTVLESWTVIIDGVKNANLATGIVFYISGQAIGRYLGKDELVGQRSIVMFGGRPEAVDVLPVEPDVVETKAEDEEPYVIVGDYTTFGRLAGVDRILLTMQIAGPNGSVYTAQEDVTAQVIDPANTEHVIRATVDIEIQERPDGGFNPEATPWEPDVTKIILE